MYKVRYVRREVSQEDNHCLIYLSAFDVLTIEPSFNSITASVSGKDSIRSFDFSEPSSIETVQRQSQSRLLLLMTVTLFISVFALFPVEGSSM